VPPACKLPRILNYYYRQLTWLHWGDETPIIRLRFWLILRFLLLRHFLGERDKNSWVCVTPTGAQFIHYFITAIHSSSFRAPQRGAFPNTATLEACAKLRLASIRFFVSVCPSAWNILVPTVQILVKFDF
jgi:hypothetical protein